MGKMLGCLAGVAELLPEDKTLTQPVLKQRKTKLLQIHIGYMIFLPLLPVFLGWQESSNRFQKRLSLLEDMFSWPKMSLLKRKGQGEMPESRESVISAALLGLINGLEEDCPTPQDFQSKVGVGLKPG